MSGAFVREDSAPVTFPARQGLYCNMLPFRFGEPESLPADLLAQLDDHTAVDAQLFAAALRLFLGRLRTVEERTGAALLACIDWERLWRKTSYIPGLWAGKGALAPAAA